MLAFRILFAAATLALFTAAHVYLYRRLVRDVTHRPRVRRLLAVLMMLGLVAVPVLRMAFRDRLEPAAASAMVLLWWGASIYTLLALLAVDAARWLLARRWPDTGQAASGIPSCVDGLQPPQSPERRAFLARATAAGALAVGSGVTAFGSYEAFAPPELTVVPLKIVGWPKALDGFTVVHLTDLHIGPVIRERFVDRLVHAANAAKPDLVAITGDLVDGSPDQLGPIVARLRNVNSRFGTFFVSGNHEYYSDWEAWAPALSGLGFTVLRNRFVTVGDAGASFDLVGVEDYGTRWGPGGYDLTQATAGRDPLRPAVLLAHQPQGLELATDARMGLQLSGHTHGGQMFPGTMVGEVIWGDRNQGLSRNGDTWLYTSRGCGFVGPPVRVGAPPEIVKVVLLSS